MYVLCFIILVFPLTLAGLGDMSQSLVLLSRCIQCIQMKSAPMTAAITNALHDIELMDDNELNA